MDFLLNGFDVTFVWRDEENRLFMNLSERPRLLDVDVYSSPVLARKRVMLNTSVLLFLSVSRSVLQRGHVIANFVYHRWPG